MLLHDFLDYQARTRPDGEFAVFGDRRLTYAEGAAAANRLANGLVARGLRVGDRVAVLSRNSLEYLLLYFACSKAGVVPVPLNYRLVPADWQYIVDDARAVACFAAGEYAPAVEALRLGLASVERTIVMDGDAPPGWDDMRLWALDQPATPPARRIVEDDDLYQMYTSGTTGHPKGAILTHRTATANILQCLVSGFDPHPGERWLVVTPFYHTAAATVSFIGTAGGASLVIQQEFNPAEVVRALAEEGIGFVFLVPAMVQACLLMVPDVATRAYPKLRLIGYAASPIAEQTLRNAMTAFRCDFMQAYGMTESGPVLTLMLPDDHRRAIAEKPELLLAAGRAVVGTEVRIVDANDQPLPPGEIGEICGRGPQLMKGYWNRPEASAEALRGGWMHTGDAGVMDAEGFVYVQDRVKDMIVSGGENIYPRQIEDVLFKHPAIADAAVIGVPDERWGETVKAVVVLKAGMAATEAEIVDYCRDRLGGFQRPRSVDFVAVLPRNLSGKVLKRELRQPYWAGHARRVAGS